MLHIILVILIPVETSDEVFLTFIFLDDNQRLGLDVITPEWIILRISLVDGIVD